MSITVTDLFCGAGGSGLGATAVPGVELVMAANHSPRAIETHAANFPDTEHDQADISQVEPRRYRPSTILWASPECTNHSQAKGRKRARQPGLFGDPLPDDVADRSRATMWDVPRFAEVHRYPGVVVENVVDAALWPMFPAWLMAMECLGYAHHTVWLNSMHAPAIAAPRAPQSRDRLYVVFWRQGNPAPDLELRPPAWCPRCAGEVAAVQVFKNGRRWGRYRAQYLYRCPTPCCATVVEPYVVPAAAAIDWALPGQRIGDRTTPLKPATLARIEAGLARYAHRPQLVPSGGTWRDGAAPTDEPMRTRTTSETDGLLVPVEARDGKQAGPAEMPHRTQTARRETALVVPYYGADTHAHPATAPLRTLPTRDRFGLAFVAELRGGGSKHRTRDVTEPLATVTAGGRHHMLVRNNSSKGSGAEMCTPVDEPARTITTKGHQSVVGWTDPPTVADCTFRMLAVGEIQAAMAFTPDYRITGTKREQVAQLGNGVTPPAAEFLIRALADSLEEAA